MRLHQDYYLLLDYETQYPSIDEFYHSQLNDEIPLLLSQTLPSFLPERLKNYLLQIRELPANDRKVLSLSFVDLNSVQTIITSEEAEAIKSILKEILEARLVPIIDFKATKPLSFLPPHEDLYLGWLSQYNLEPLLSILDSENPEAIVKSKTGIYVNLNYSKQLCQDGQILFNLQQQVLRDINTYFNTYTTDGRTLDPNYNIRAQLILALVNTGSITELTRLIDYKFSCQGCPISMTELKTDPQVIKACLLYTEANFKVAYYNRGFKNGLNEELNIQVPDFNFLAHKVVLHYDPLWVSIFQGESFENVKYNQGIFYIQPTDDNHYNQLLDQVQNLETDIEAEWEADTNKGIIALTDYEYWFLKPQIKRYKYDIIKGSSFKLDDINYTIYKTQIPPIILRLTLVFDNLLTELFELVGR